MNLKKIAISMLLLASGTLASAQTELKKPEASQYASVTQRIGLSTISITYHSPLAKGRNIWGKLVPYNEVWRAGANENTTISFSSDVKIEGQALAAGTYGLHMIPTEKEWTVIFSTNYYAWGSFFYTPKEDALRVTVNPKSAPMQDWLSYTFTNPQPQSVNAEMHWEKMSVSFAITVDVPEVVYQSMKKELTNAPGFQWQAYNQAANHCISNGIHLDEAAEWVKKSLDMQQNFTNLSSQSRLLQKQGKNEEAGVVKKQAFSLADESQLNNYGYELIAQGKTAEAFEIFKLNVARYPKSWNVYDSLGEVLEMMGDTKGAISNYKIALSKAPEVQRKRIAPILSRLEGK